MASSSRRQSNGRSPLVNPQRQITSFFSKSTSLSPSPPLSKPNPISPKPATNPNSTRSSSPNTDPTTPSPLQSKSKKPLLVIGASPSSPAACLTFSPPISDTEKSYSVEVVDKRIRVYWPLDKCWYEGVVKSFDAQSGKHVVQYDDGDEEELDLGKEKVELVVEAVKRLKRLRRGSALLKNSVAKDEDVENMDEIGCVEDDSSDEDWGKNLSKEAVEDEDDEMDVELEDADENSGLVRDMAKKRSAGKCDSRKRKENEKENLGSLKKSKGDVGSKAALAFSLTEPTNINEIGKNTNGFDNGSTGDAAERFNMREAEKLPFLGKERRDAKRRHPGDSDYDPKTLYLPPDFVKSLSGGQRQWWEFKSKHMDKVLFFKMGKFYELFEMDARVGAKELDLQYMKGVQPHCGFPEKNFAVNAEKLARKGYRVLVIEQTETPEQLEFRRKEKGSKDKVVKREICAVVTKGTLTEGEMLSANPDASYLLALTESCQSLTNLNVERIFGVCLVDIATSSIILGQFKDDLECSALCCLLCELRPVEIIKPAKLLSPETERVLLRHTRNPLVNELVPVLEFWDAEKTISEVKRLCKHIIDQSGSGPSSSMHDMSTCDGDDQLSCLPDVLSNLVNDGEKGSCALSALGGILYYLKQAYMDESLLRYAKFELLPCSAFGDISKKPYMVLDATALENLEIFENSKDGDSSGTLYAQLNHCVTACGKRLLKTWLARPLYNFSSIKERQEAVAGLRGTNLPCALEFRKALAGLPDMERLLSRIFVGSEANGRNANKVVLYEDAAKKQLQEFISALRGCKLMWEACSSLSVVLETAESRQLHHILTPGKGLPDISSVIVHFKDAFDWVEANNSGRIIPHEGVDVEYDSACKAVTDIESSLTKHLKEQRKIIGNTSISYVTVGKESYLLEVPDSLRARIPGDYELQSSKKGFFRYWNPSIKKLLGELSQAEQEKESALKSILLRLIGKFCKHHNQWRQLVSVIAELDVLISLVIASEYYEGPTCRPIILDPSCSNEVPCFSAKSLGHPILRSDSLGKSAFVPNDITLGSSGHSNFILLTGPNMGGKSTLLRQVCLAVILAQVGADVPAENLQLSPVDRIFVRMGAKDHIMAGQSTFLTELSETASMLSSATCNSLVALDELGRGTSTSDGQAIAESVLEHFIRKVRCRGMFSTHYHRLALNYQKDPKVSLCHMACQVGNGVEGVEEVTFLYRLASGTCPKSYGVNVARLAGLPDSLLRKAAAKSREFEDSFDRHGIRSEENLWLRSWVDEVDVLIRTSIEFSEKSTCDGYMDTIASSPLAKLQHRVRILLQQH